MTDTKTARIPLQRGIAYGGTALLCLLVLLTGCDPNLDVENPNEPNRSDVLATGADVESLIVSSFQAYHDVAHSDLGGIQGCGGDSWTSTINSLADHTTSTWGNYGHNPVASEPRQALPNTSASPNQCLIAVPWFRAYQGLAAASEGLKALDAGVQIDDGAGNARARAWAKFSQGLLHGQLALLYDKAFSVDETVQLVDESGEPIQPEFLSYREMAQAAVGYFQAAIDIANQNDFETPAGWTNGRVLTSDELAALAHSNIARYRARWPRNPSEAQEVDWAAVQSNLEQGHDFHFGSPTTGEWWSGLEVWTEWGGGAQQFAMVDNKTVGPADTSGAYQNWVNTPASERTPSDVPVILSPDERIPDPMQSITLSDGSSIAMNYGCLDVAVAFGFNTQETTGPVDGNPACGMAPSYIGWHVGFFMPATSSGLSHYSRYETYYGPCNTLQASFANEGFICDFTTFDKDMLMAEALWRQGQGGQAAAILNDYREGAGLGDVTATGVSGEDCVPRMPDGSCADFIHTLAYETGLIRSSEHTGDMWADKRRWGMLTTGTALQFPIPSQELNTLGEDLYTFGGVGGAGAAPVIQPGDQESILRKVRWSLNALEMQRQRRAQRPSTGAQRLIRMENGETRLEQPSSVKPPQTGMR